MHRFMKLLMAGFLLALLTTPPLQAAEDAPPLKGVGDSAPIFTLASNQDSLFSYDRDIYGKHHLIITFFPAAFTPV